MKELFGQRLREQRIKHGLTLEQLAEQTHLSKSALGSYEAEDFKDSSHYRHGRAWLKGTRPCHHC